MGHSCVAGVTEVVELTQVLSAARPGNDEAVGHEAVAEQFFSFIQGACQGSVAAEKWSEQIAPDDMTLVDARNAAAQTKTQARVVKIMGATAGALAESN